MSKHRKSGAVGSFTIHAPEDYRPKHRSDTKADSPSMARGRHRRDDA